MECCSSAIERLPVSTEGTGSSLPSFLPQLNLFMCRVQWILAPYPSDEGSFAQDCGTRSWIGAAKAFFWLAAAIGTGILIAGLSG